jgi:hypothetical protein
MQMIEIDRLLLDAMDENYNPIHTLAEFIEHLNSYLPVWKDAVVLGSLELVLRRPMTEEELMAEQLEEKNRERAWIKELTDRFNSVYGEAP